MRSETVTTGITSHQVSLYQVSQGAEDQLQGAAYNSNSSSWVYCGSREFICARIRVKSTCLGSSGRNVYT